MNERSPELKNVLVESLNPEQIHAKHKMLVEHSQEYYQEQHRKNWERVSEDLATFEEAYRGLLEHGTDLSDDDFEDVYQKADAELNRLLAELNRASDEVRESRVFKLDFVDVSQVESLDAFLKKGPMQFIPRKREVGEMLALVKRMHAERQRKGIAKESEPLRVVDIGGSNGALGKLMTDLAAENGLAIEYTIVDPDTTTVNAASSHYADNPRLHFLDQTADAYVRDLYKDKPEIQTALDKRDELIRQGKRKSEDLKRVLQDIQTHDGEDKLDEKTMEIFSWILKTDFGLVSSDDLIKDGLALLDVYLKPWREKVDALTRDIEKFVGKEPAQFDLVVNSWMPGGLDFTKEIRETNGTAILYATERYGATGHQRQSYQQDPIPLGEEYSYAPGEAYEQKRRWSSRSMTELSNSRSESPLERHLSSERPLSNGFIVQVKRGYSGSILKPFTMSPESQGIVVQGEYPWEKELNERDRELPTTS